MSNPDGTTNDLLHRLEAAEERLGEMHEILNRKNAIIRLLAMGDLSAEEIKLSDDGSLVVPPKNHA